MGFFAWLFLGAVAGYVAKWLMPDKMPESTIATVLIGVLGAMLGRGLVALLALGATGGLGILTIVVGVLGTLLLVYGYNKVTGE
jgi:uncharacterized membrane protein YeaQ/YmgE (transglycosylase-associated protein family)